MYQQKEQARDGLGRRENETSLPAIVTGHRVRSGTSLSNPPVHQLLVLLHPFNQINPIDTTPVEEDCLCKIRVRYASARSLVIGGKLAKRRATLCNFALLVLH